MPTDENIVLDARVLSVIDSRAFRAELANGHGFTAYFPQADTPAAAPRCAPGDRVRVRMSPFDFSRGEIQPISKKQETET